MANLKVGKKFKLNGDTVQVVSINADGTATLNYAAGSGRTGFAGKVALNVGSKTASTSGITELDSDEIEIDDAVVTLDSYNDYEDELMEDFSGKRPIYDAAKFDSQIFEGYQKNGKREFRMGMGGDFTDSTDYSPEALEALGFTKEAYEHVNRLDVNGNAPSEDLVAMRTSFLAASMAHEQAIKEFKEIKTPMFANDYDKYKPRFDAMYKAEDAARRVRFYSELTNRAEAEVSKYKTTGDMVIKPKSGTLSEWQQYRYIDGGVPIYRELHEVKWGKKVENEHYVFMTDDRVTKLFDLRKMSDGSEKARREAYQAYRKDYEADFVPDIM